MTIDANRIANPPPDFHPGDPVMVLYQGLYSGLAGTFVGPAEDANWALIKEEDGVVRSHPRAWMRRPESVVTTPLADSLAAPAA